MGYFEQEFATVEYDAGIDAVVARQTGFAGGTEFREYMESIIDAVEDTGSSKLLTDTREAGTVDEEDQAWSATDWSPRAEAAGLERMAMVMPESVVAELSVEQVIEMTEDDMDRELFDDLDEARAWLQN